MSKVTLKIVLDPKSKEVKKSIFLAVTYERITRQYSLGINLKLTKKEFDNPRLKITKEALELATPYYNKAVSIAKELEDNFSFILFSERFRGNEKKKCEVSKDVQDIFDHYIQEKKLRQGTIDSYKTVVNHLTCFKHGIKITDLDVDMVLKFQEYLRKNYRENNGKDMADATIGIYMRSLRALYKYAEKVFDLPHKRNPFGEGKIVIPNSSASHRAMNDEDFQKLLRYKPCNKNEEFALDMFLISFGLGGMNLVDILQLKNKNIISNQELEFVREKTKNRTKKEIVTQLYIPPKILALMGKYASFNPNSQNSFIFPFLNITMTDKQRLRKRKDINKMINSGLKDICKNAGITNITTYWARHTVATRLYNDGQTATVISKVLGHASTNTTDTYLAQLGLGKKKEIETSISNFIEDLEIG